MYKYELKKLMFTAWENNKRIMNGHLRDLNRDAVREIMAKSLNDYVLVVDDEVEFTDVVFEFLGADFNVVIANTLEEANDMIKTYPVGLAFIDMIIGEEHGVAFIKQHPEIETILISGHCPKVLYESFDVPGNVQIMSKPFKLSELSQIASQKITNYVPQLVLDFA